VVWKSSSNFDKKLNQAVSTCDCKVQITSSSNGGASWSTPTAIVGPSTLPLFTPTVAVDSKGNVAVTYYDSGSLSPTNTATWPIDVKVIYSKDGVNFTAPQEVAGPFDLMSAPVARGFFLGDYEGLQSTGTKSFIAMFVTTNCNLNPSDPNGPPIGNTSLCGPAGSVSTPTPNNDPTNVFSAALSAP